MSESGLTLERFEKWWNEEGSGMRPIDNHDHEEHAHRIARIAWENGAYVERETREERY